MAGEAKRVVPGAYWPRPWTAEDGGPRRLCRPDGQPGLGIEPNERLEVTASRDAFASDMVIRREPGELYALRHTIPPGDPLAGDVDGWVERLDQDHHVPFPLSGANQGGVTGGGRYHPGASLPQ
ncbi:MAG: hypothetical protein ACKOGM_02935, partial [Solirubrobacterales bacterium]